MSTRTRTLYDLASSDTIDSRQFITRLRELEGSANEHDEALLRGESLPEPEEGDFAEPALDEDEHGELAALRDICERGESFPDWKDGTTLIRDSYFTEYAEDYADSTGQIDHDSWLTPYVDWERVASDLKSDYSTIEIEGETYYGRD